MTAYAIEVCGLVKRFGAHRALDGLDLAVVPGEVHGFLGPNGAGKSTTIRVLLGLYRRDEGEVTVLGLDPQTHPAEVTGRVSYVPGDVTLWPNLTGQEVLDAFAGLRRGGGGAPGGGGARGRGGRRGAGRDHTYDRAAERRLVEAFALDPRRTVRTYSKGNRQKVALVAAFAARTELLILDEPTTGLDPLMEEVFQDTVRHAAADGRTVLLSSHLLDQVERLCESVTIVKDGRVVETGRVADLRHLASSRVTAKVPPAQAEPLRSQLRERLGEVASDGTVRLAVPTDDIPAVLQTVLAHGGHDLTCTPAGLDDLFLRHYAAAAR